MPISESNTYDKAPAILEHNQPGAMQKAASAFMHKRHSDQVCGKGDKPRTNLSSKAWQEGYDRIFKKK